MAKLTKCDICGEVEEPCPEWIDKDKEVFDICLDCEMWLKMVAEKKLKPKEQ